MNNTSSVLLPEWIWQEAKDKEHFKRLVKEYMKRYPDYTVKSVKGKLAICDRG